MNYLIIIGIIVSMIIFNLGPSVADYICDFEGNHTCGFEWQSNLLPFARVDHLEWSRTSGLMMLDLKKVNVSIAPGARLNTAYYPSYSLTNACLTVKFMMFGSGINRFAIIQRGSSDHRLYEYDNDWYPAQPSSNLDQYWITLTVPIDLFEGNVMFFFEVTTNGHTPNGLFVLDHVAFLYYKCPFKQMPHYPCLDDSCANPHI